MEIEEDYLNLMACGFPDKDALLERAITLIEDFVSDAMGMEA